MADYTYVEEHEDCSYRCLMVLSISARSFIFLKVPVCVYGGGEIVRVAARVVPAPPLRDITRALSPAPGAQGLHGLIRPLPGQVGAWLAHPGAALTLKI